MTGAAAGFFVRNATALRPTRVKRAIAAFLDEIEVRAEASPLTMAPSLPDPLCRRLALKSLASQAGVVFPSRIILSHLQVIERVVARSARG
ncbi:hypothetical protein [Mesorhizobium sp.]|uniref:hypothetical protein n=1 Tax=Mesorhizobium sp. TaxID=1871066 RepID=UPI0025FC6ADE|nr:hypothetical protein [Mesorhizobium sp.]